MASGECQLCGRRLRILIDGAIVFHYRKGAVCQGSGAPPMAESTGAIRIAIHHFGVRDKQLTAQFETHRNHRTNEPLPADFWANWAHVCHERLRLIRRLQNKERRQ